MVNPGVDTPKHVVCKPGEGRTLVIDGVTITLKVTGQETDNAFTVFEATLPPHHAGTSLHVHRLTTEALWVIKGTLAVTLGEDTIIARCGSFLSIPPGTIHTFWNPTTTPATYVVLCSPAGFEHHIEALAALGTTESICSAAADSRFESLGIRYDIFPALPQP